MKQLNQSKLTTKKILLLIGVLIAGFEGQTQVAHKVGDNLGNHTATQDLNMATTNKIVDAKGIIIGAATFTLDNVYVSLELNGDNKAFLVNRVTNVLPATIGSPIDGMMVYSNADHRFYFRNNGIWETFASSTNSVWSITADALSSTGANSNGFTITPAAGTGNVKINLQPADLTNPGVVTASGTQNFGGDKTFAGAVTVSSGSLNINGTGLLPSSVITDQVLVVDNTGLVKTTTLIAGMITKLPVAIPTGVSAKFYGPNLYYSFDIIVNGVQVDDGVVVNFQKADAGAFLGLTIKNVVASATNTITIQLEDDRSPTEYTTLNIDGKNLIVTWLHK